MEDSTKNKSKIINQAPKFLQEILPYISPRIFDLIDIPTVTLNMAKLSYQYLFSIGVEEIKKDFQPFLPSGITFKKDEKDEMISDKDIGEKILEIYFLQILRPGKIFLDLRSNLFNKKSGNIQWKPNGIYCVLEESFRHGLVNLYKGFYLNDEVLYFKGMFQIGLISETDPPEIKTKMKSIFDAHFGDGNQEQVIFKLEKFSESFHQIFDFIYQQQKKLSPDFVYLGIYLVALYEHLEKLPVALNVRKSFINALEKVSK